MNVFTKLPALVAVSALLAAGPAAAYGNPIAPESEQNATTVQVRDMDRAAGRSAPRSGVNPTAPRSTQNATTVQLREQAAPSGRDAPRSGVNPSAPAYQQD